jgi:hypothetical protein
MKIGYMLFFIKNTIFIILVFLLSCKIVISCTIIPLNIDLFPFNFFNLEFYLNFSSFSKKHRKLHKKKQPYFLRVKNAHTAGAFVFCTLTHCTIYCTALHTLVVTFHNNNLLFVYDVT